MIGVRYQPGDMREATISLDAVKQWGKATDWGTSACVYTLARTHGGGR